jgi:NOL1/NOP2/fmu family ribosome biogenesis protein
LRRLDPETRREILHYFEERFGIEGEEFARVEFIERGIHIWCVSRSPVFWEPEQWRIETPGIRLVRRTNFGFKPTTFGLQIVGRRAIRNVVVLPALEAIRFARGATLQGSFDVTPGYVVVRIDEFVLGCGLYKRGGYLISQIPKSVRTEVRPEG